MTDFEAATISVSFAVASIVCLTFYFLCRLRRDMGEPSAILLAMEKKQALEKEKKEKLTIHLASHSLQVKEEHLKFVIQCCDIDCSSCSNENIECPEQDDIDETDITYSPRLMVPMGVNDYGQEYGEKSAKCAICIEEYAKGDVVVSSSNRQCQHLFHFDCILTWLSKSTTGDSGNHCCPVCRQLFIVDEQV